MPVGRIAPAAALAVALGVLAACGGGQASRPAPAAQAQPAPGPAIPTLEVRAAPIRQGAAAFVPEGSGGSAVGHYALPGINLIPPRDLKLSHAQVRDAVLIADLNPRHGAAMRTAACGAYVIACDDPHDLETTPFRFLIPPSSEADVAAREKHEAAVRMGSRIVSHSLGPAFALMDAHFGDALPYALVQPTGNSGFPSVFTAPLGGLPNLSVFRYDPFREALVYRFTDLAGTTLESTDTLFGYFHQVFRNIRAAVKADRVIYTAGYTIDRDGREVRHPSSNGCAGVEEGCVWVTYSVWDLEDDPGEMVSGTSYGPPRVAMAMASMLSVYPDLSPTNLVFLTRACARPVETLPGNGIADFSCMLDIGESGVVSVKDTEDLGLPDIIPPFRLPGSLMVATRLVDRQGRESPFRKRIPAAPMAHRSGLALANPGTSESIRDGLPPQFRLAIREDVDLFGIQGSERRPGLGLVWRRGPLFAAVGHAVRDRFFGFAGGGGAWNFRGTREVGVNLGHDNLHLRFTNQRTRSRAQLEGNSIGVTARKEFQLRGDWTLGLLAEADRFLGGKARIPGMGGAAKIAAGKPGYRGEIRLTRPF